MLKVKELLAKIMQNTSSKTVLYDNTSGTASTITLPTSAANFQYLEIYYKDNDGIFAYTRVYNPNGRTVALTIPHADTARGTLYTKSSCAYISGTSISFNRQIQAHMFNGSGYGIQQNNYILITRIIGHKCSV